MAELKLVITAKNQAKAVLNGLERQTASLRGLAPGVMGGLATGAAVAGTAVIGLGTAVAGVAADGTRMAATLQEQMSGIQAVMGLTADEAAQLSEAITAVGLDPTLKVSTFEAAEAVAMLGRNGLNMQQVMDGALHSTILLANATGADFGTAADIATDTMGVFNIEAAQMAEAVNGITSVVNNSKFDINDYAIALGQGGGAAATAGVEFEDFNTTLVAMAELVAGGSQAGTSMRQMLTRLQPQTKNATEQMRDLGLITEQGSNVFYDSAGNLQSMANVAGSLNTALDGLSEAQRNQALTTLFGAEAIQSAIALAKTGEEEFSNLQAVMGETDAAASAAIRTDNLTGKMDTLGGVVEATRVQIGEAFLPAVEGLAEAMIPLAETLAPKVVSFFESMAAITTTTGPQISETFASIGAAFTTLAEAMQSRFGDDMAELSETFGPMNEALGELGKSFGELFSTVGQLFGFEDGGALTEALGSAAIEGLSLAIEGAIAGIQSQIEGVTILAQNMATVVQTISSGVESVSTILSGMKLQEIQVPDWLSSLSDFQWPEFITQPTWIATLLKWAWPVFIEPIDWVTKLMAWNWPEFITRPDWLDGLFGFDWPTLSKPGWLDTLLSWTGGGGEGTEPATNATGTLNFPGGLTWVGERGPELIAPPRGSRIFNNSDSMALAGTGSITVNVNVAEVNSDLDLNSMAHHIADIINRRRR